MLTDALVIQIAALTADFEKGMKRATDRIRALEAEASKADRGMGAAFGRMGITADNLKRSFGNVATGVLMMTGAFDEAGKVGKVLEQTLGAFMVGGPLGAGVALLSGSFKLLAGDTQAAGKAAEEAQKSYEKYFAELKKGAEEAQKAAQDAADTLADLKAGVVEGTHGKLRTRAGVNSAIEEAEIQKERFRAELQRAELRRRLVAEHQALAPSLNVDADGRDIEGRRKAIADELAQLDRFGASRPIAQIEEDAKKAAAALDILHARLRAINEAEQAADEIQSIRDARAGNAAVGAAGGAVANALANAGRAVNGRGGGASGSDMRSAVKEVGSAWSEAAAAVVKYATEVDRANRLVKEQTANADELVARYRAEADAIGTVNEAERARKEILEDIRRLVAAGTIGEGDKGRVFDAMWSRWQSQQAASAKAASAKVGRDAGESFAQTFTETVGENVRLVDPFFAEMGQMIGSTLIGSLVDGIFDGEFHLQDALKQIAKNALTRTLNDVFSMLLGGLLGGLGGGGGGFGAASILQPLIGAATGAIGGGNYAPSIGGGTGAGDGGCAGGT